MEDTFKVILSATSYPSDGLTHKKLGMRSPFNELKKNHFGKFMY